jgi:hypothetical protein
MSSLQRLNPVGDERILVTGQTNTGRYLTVSLAPTNDAGTWRPITGWDATAAERGLFEHHTR